MNARKILCVLMAALILVSLCSCGKDPSSVSGEQTVTPGPSTSGTITESEPASEPETETESDENFSVGATLNNTYKNEYFGIGITLDDNWVFSTQEEINEINGFVQDTLDDDAYNKAFESGIVYTDMNAHDVDSQFTINTTIEKLNAFSTFAIDEEQYVDLSMENADLKGVLEGMGFEISLVEKGSVTIAGEEHPGIVIEGSIQGIDFCEKVAVIKKGNYIMGITVSALMDNIVDDIFATFYTL